MLRGDEAAQSCVRRCERTETDDDKRLIAAYSWLAAQKGKAQLRASVM